MSLFKKGRVRYLLVLAATVFLLILPLLILSYSKIEGLSIEQKIQQENQALITTVVIFTAVIVVLNTYYVALSAAARIKNTNVAKENIKLTEKKILSENLSQGISQLGNHNIDTRTATIYALELISQDFPAAHWTIMEILIAFVRENPPGIDFLSQYTNEIPKLGADVQAALKVIGRRDTKKETTNQILNLRNADLPGANLKKANLRAINLKEANLQEANLFFANLNGANLMQANLQGANLFLANLQKTILVGANLAEATLCAANLDAANLTQANLCQATLCAANLEGADLTQANLYQADLSDANLNKVILIQAKLQGTDLRGVKNLEYQQIISAYGDKTTRLPSYLQFPEHWR
jgi:uncharacterized protein YjbI with pentapeptide repeats